MQTDVPDLVPVRILNEHVYCPRLAYLEWAGGVFEDSADTVEGRWVHRRVDRERGKPPATTGQDGGVDPPPSSSVSLSSERLGLIAKIDMLEPRGQTVVPIEYKRGRPRSHEQPLRDPELVQVCAHVLLLREAGFRVDHAEVYFHETRSRHRVEITGETVALTLVAISEVRANAALSQAPAPLVDSPKCPRCSLVGLCLPDEVTLLRGDHPAKPRRLVASDPAAQPLYISSQGARLTKHSERLVLIEDGIEVASRRLIDVSHLSVFGNVTIGSAAVRACLEAGIPVLWFTYGGWFVGAATGISAGSIELRLRQHRAAAVGAGAIAGAIVAGKIRNGRTLLRRHGGPQAVRSVEQLAGIAAQAEVELDTGVLLGLEGTAARIYFEGFARLLKGPTAGEFDFTARNRRPPRDRVNALLSFAYAMLVKDATVACIAAGLDPHVGLYHRPRFGRPSLALDLVEEFRPLVGDSVVMTAINNGEVDADDFVERAGAVALRPAGRRKFIVTYERRMTTELKHPVFGYRATYRRTLEIQARLLAATLLGDIPAYRPLTTR
jgi:CRISP-associated protein Cas1